MPDLLAADAYAVTPMPLLRPGADILACFLNARAVSPMWRTTPAGSAYQLQDSASFIYLGTTPESAYFEYSQYVLDGNPLRCNRTFEQMSFWLGGQELNASSRHFGAVATTYDLPSGPYSSRDRAHPGLWT